VPISETITNADEKDALESLVASLPTSKKLRFNFSYHAHQCLSELFSKMPNEGLVCIFDMGVVSSTTIPKQKSMYGIYGACIFFSVYFPHICYIAKQHGWDASITNVKEGHSQMALFYRGVPSKTFSTFCNTHLCQEQGEDAFSAQKTLLEISKKRSAKAFSAKTKETLDSLNSHQKESYALLTCLAQEYQKRGMVEDAAKTCNTIISLYGRTGITAQLILATILNDINHTEDALEILTHAIKTAPYFFRRKKRQPCRLY
jgi:tetratricopeptide (TPR) repeat protein